LAIQMLSFFPDCHEAAIPLVRQDLCDCTVHLLQDSYFLGEKTKGEHILDKIGLAKTYDVEPVIARQIFQRRLGKELYMREVIGAALNSSALITEKTFCFLHGRPHPVVLFLHGDDGPGDKALPRANTVGNSDDQYPIGIE